MRNVLILTCIALALGACARFGRSNMLFDGQYYTGSVRTAGDDKHDFTATVRPVSRGLEGAREAGRHQGTKYCIRYYGISEIDWAVGPDTPAEALVAEDDTLTFAGRCVE